MTMSVLRRQEIGNAAGIYNLMRNIGGSIGIATVTAFLVRGAQTHQNYLAGNVTATNPMAMAALEGLQAKFFAGGASAHTAQQDALGALYRSIQQQASLLAYADNFRMLAYLSLACIPMLLFLVRLRHRKAGAEKIVSE
jgi:DHA2 family multidrug resistance protein